LPEFDEAPASAAAAGLALQSGPGPFWAATASVELVDGVLIMASACWEDASALPIAGHSTR